MQGTHSFDASLFQEQRHTGAGSFVGSSAIEDDVAIARDEFVFMFDLFRRKAQRTHDGVGFTLEVERMAQVDDKDVLARIHHRLQFVSVEPQHP
jgi:hypothetical protein